NRPSVFRPVILYVLLSVSKMSVSCQKKKWKTHCLEPCIYWSRCVQECTRPCKLCITFRTRRGSLRPCFISTPSGSTVPPPEKSRCRRNQYCAVRFHVCFLLATV
ncbi:unnamed protein product, partial [Ixodes hexagonus]